MLEVKKRRGDSTYYACQTYTDAITHRIHQFQIPFALTDSEHSFIKWHSYIQETLPNTDFKGFINLASINVNDDEYCKTLEVYVKSCQIRTNLDQQLNRILCESVSSELREKLSLSPAVVSCCNFETIKWYFQSKITVFHLMDMEGCLFFDKKNKIQFLHDVDYLISVYTLVFGTVPTPDIKINWIINALNKDRIRNKGILHEIQQNWQIVSRDICQLRKVISEA